MKFLFAAGGTAGHINPALAIADKLKYVLPESEIKFVGTPEGMEARLVVKAGYDFVPIRMAGFQRRLTLNNVKRNIKAAKLYFDAKKAAKKLIGEYMPDAVIGTGGYISGIILGTAASMGIKTATHESNSFPGVATKMLAKKADKVFVVSEDTLAHLPRTDNCIVTGNPLRCGVPIEDRETARKKLGLPEGMTVLSFGGSLGANRITEAVIEMIKWENKKGNINHIHSYGGNGREMFEKLLDEGGVKINPERTRLLEYIDNMYTCMAAADLIIARAGAMTLTEIQEIGRASVLVPFPHAAENHQYYNALTMQKNNAAALIEDKDFTKAKALETLSYYYEHPAILEVMSENAKKLRVSNSADIIVSEILDMLKDDKKQQ